MKLKEYDILIDLKKHKQIEDIEVVAGDFGSNILNINIAEGVEDYELAGLNIEIAFAKSDGTTVLQDMYNGVELIGNKIKCTLKTNTIASPGKVLAEIRILEGVKLLTTARFSFYVRKPIVDNDTVESTNEYPILGQLIEDVNVLIDDIASKPEIRGYSAYQIWINEGNTGTVDDYLGSLIGPPGPQGEPGPEGPKGPTGSITNLDKGNIEDALGYTPTKSINDILPDAAGNIAVELASDIEVINNLTETVAGKALDATKGKFLKDELDTHKADNVSQVLEVSRDLSITGKQTITLLNKKVKSFIIHAYILSGNQRNILFRGSGGTPSGSATTIENTIINVTGIYFKDSSGNVRYGNISTPSLGVMEIDWSMAAGTSYAGTVRLQILVDYN